jgi:hypothetical protein
VNITDKIVTYFDVPHTVLFNLKMIPVEIKEKFVIFIKPSMKVSAN